MDDYTDLVKRLRSLRDCNICTDAAIDDAADAIEAQAARIAELEAVMKLGVNFALNVRGSWDAFEPLLRREIGNTNYRCVQEKSVAFLEAARTALEGK